jgi:DNA polymerase alpha subunit B
VKLTDPSLFDNVTQRYRFMFTTLEERARSLDQHLLQLQAEMCEALGLSESELAPLGLPAPDAVWVCGRVCNESPSGKMNETSLVLEGSRVFSGGRRVELDLRALPAFAVFPGQIVMVHGINSSGRKMVGACAAHPLDSCHMILLCTQTHT